MYLYPNCLLIAKTVEFNVPQINKIFVDLKALVLWLKGVRKLLVTKAKKKFGVFSINDSLFGNYCTQSSVWKRMEFIPQNIVEHRRQTIENMENKDRNAGQLTVVI